MIESFQYEEKILYLSKNLLCHNNNEKLQKLFGKLVIFVLNLKKNAKKNNKKDAEFCYFCNICNKKLDKINTNVIIFKCGHCFHEICLINELKKEGPAKCLKCRNESFFSFF